MNEGPDLARGRGARSLQREVRPRPEWGGSQPGKSGVVGRGRVQPALDPQSVGAGGRRRGTGGQGDLESQGGAAIPGWGVTWAT